MVARKYRVDEDALAEHAPSRDRELDALTRLVAHVLEVPIAFVSLVEGQRVSFAAGVGADRALDSSLWGHLVDAREPLVVSDILVDPRFAALPFARSEPCIRFYARYPLRTRSGHTIGFLSVADHEPRTLTPHQLATLELVCAQVLLHVESLDQAASTRDDQHREVLLKEMHHRTKNSLQLVASLASMQVRQLSDTASVEAFHGFIARVHAISQVHEALYQSSSTSDIELGTYLGAVTRTIVGALGYSDRIQTHCESDAHRLEARQAITCGIIVAELVTNAIKHAFPDERTGTIRLVVERDDASFRVTVADNGAGLSPRSPAEGSFGHQLVRILTRELGGSLRFDGEHGTSVVLAFPGH